MINNGGECFKSKPDLNPSEDMTRVAPSPHCKNPFGFEPAGLTRAFQCRVICCAQFPPDSDTAQIVTLCFQGLFAPAVKIQHLWHLSRVRNPIEELTGKRRKLAVGICSGSRRGKEKLGSEESRFECKESPLEGGWLHAARCRREPSEGGGGGQDGESVLSEPEKLD
ncbi:unnamed protein product [Pleuronectes platessa]|uniref:Uncharacterized protein n=1 Tax=Pleuronectes platessa TaxID=8262 RepID=A0A9N7ZE58_PLEPL|nr:unnamed protein product [Pleuronectes platessa]